MALSFAFGGDTGTTYDDLKRRQAYAQAMWARGGQGSPKNAWEGLNSAAQSITGALLARKLGRELKGQQDEFGTMFNAALGGFGGQSASVPPAPKMNPVDQAYPVGMEGPAPERNTVTAGGKQYDMGTTAPWAGLEDVKAGIFAGESGGDYDALFGFSNRDGGKFAGNKLTDMTVDQALAFADPSGPYGQWVKGQVGRVATPMGAYQVVGTTLNAAKKAMGLRGDERMTPELQDQIGRWIHDTQGTGAWEGYRGPAKPGQAPSGGTAGGVTNPMLLAMLADPRASDSQRGVLQMLLQQQIQNADPMRKLQMQKLQAEIDATGKLTPYQRAQLDMAQARLDKPDPTSDQQNYKFYSDQVTAAGQTPLPFNDWMLQSKRAGATTVNNVVGSESSYDKELGQSNAKKFIEIQDAAQASQSKIATLDALAGALDQVSYTGFGADTALAMRRAGNAFGLDLGDTGPEEMAKALGNQLALQMRNPSGGAGMPGAMSDKDREFLVASVPGIEKTPEGNRKLIEFSKKIEQRSIDVARRATEYANRNNGRLDYRFFDELAKWADANPLFSSAAPSAASPQPAPITRDEYKTLSDEELLRRLKEQ